MEYVINFKNGSQILTTDWLKMYETFMSRSDVNNIFKEDDIIFSPDVNKVMECKPKGVKHSSYKLPMEKLFVQFPLAMQAIVLASTFGHEKYKATDHPERWDNFKNVPDAYNQYKGAAIRHEFETKESEESGLHPEFHILWNAVARFQMWAEENKVNVSKLAEQKIKEWKKES